MTHKMSSCILFPLLVAIPLLGVLFVFGLVVVVCFFVCLISFVSDCVFFWFLAGTTRWIAYRSTTNTFVAIDK